MRPLFCAWLAIFLWGACVPTTAAALTLEKGFTLRATDGRIFTLANIVPAMATETQRAASEDWLRKALEAQRWTPIPTGQPPDRYGRLPGRFKAGQTDLATAMLRDGWAWVSFDIPLATRAAKLLAVEAEARMAKRGLWRDTHPIPFAEAAPARGRYGFVEGRVLRVEERKGHRFLAFGEDWRSDPTGFIPASVVPRFEGLDALPGKPVRLRGWIEEQNGPSILLLQPYALEVLP